MVSLVTLRDGTPAWVWPLLPTDREALAAEFEQLSPESKRSRFLRPVVHLSEAMLHHLVDDVDGIDHVALVLMAEVGDDLVPAGIARCVRYPEQREAADVAVTVKDDWHGRGVATALLEQLMQQRPEGVTHLITEVAADNPASLAMLRRLGPTKVLDTGMGIFDVEVDLVPVGRFLTVEEPPERLHPVLDDPARGAFRRRDRVCPWLRSYDDPETDPETDPEADRDVAPEPAEPESAEWPE